MIVRLVELYEILKVILIRIKNLADLIFFNFYLVMVCAASSAKGYFCYNF